MILIPAIDLKDGHCVRLKQGDMDQSTTFGEDPAAMAQSWLEKGARRLHLVDLNGAFAGKPQNFAAIKSILKAVGDEIPVQLGGGIRDLDTIEKYIDGGLRYVIIGTAAVKNPGFLRDACSAFGGHIIVGLDAKDGKVATDGWPKTAKWPPTVGANSPATKWSTWPKNLKTGASSPSFTPTLAAMAC
ncbi:MAG: 1-(5-phosphoribosyl)-5-[(5-phosphoribosylamino)methylideneamino] imidazole-4-carboxamide isomerase [Pseudomonadota bacterium]